MAGPALAPRADWVVLMKAGERAVRVTLTADGATVMLDGAEIALLTDWMPGQRLVGGTFGGKPFAVRFRNRTEGYEMRLRGVTEQLIVCSPRAAELHAKLPEKQPADTSRLIMSPMPGLVVSVEASVGQEVKAGEAVAIVEAMKMQNVIRAERDGVVAAIKVEAGASVAADEVLVELA
jgi:propionyl-CoA carboxylase alpha chain